MAELEGDNAGQRGAPGERRTSKMLARAWCELTQDEQKALLIILGLFVLGLAARYCL